MENISSTLSFTVHFHLAFDTEIFSLIVSAMSIAFVRQFFVNYTNFTKWELKDTATVCDLVTLLFIIHADFRQFYVNHFFLRLIYC